MKRKEAFKDDIERKEPIFRLNDLVLVKMQTTYDINRMISASSSACKVIDPHTRSQQSLDWMSVWPLPRDAASRLYPGNSALALWNNSWAGGSTDSSWTTTYYPVTVSKRGAENGFITVTFENDVTERRVPSQVQLDDVYGSVPGVSFLSAPFGSNMQQVLHATQTSSTSSVQHPAAKRAKIEMSEEDSEEDVPIALKVTRKDQAIDTAAPMTVKPNPLLSAPIQKQSRPFDMAVKLSNANKIVLTKVSKNKRERAQQATSSSKSSSAKTTRMSITGGSLLLSHKLNPSNVQAFQPVVSAAATSVPRLDTKATEQQLVVPHDASSYQVPLTPIKVDFSESYLLGPLKAEDKGVVPADVSKNEDDPRGFVSALGAWHSWDQAKRLSSRSTETSQFVVAAYVLP